MATLVFEALRENLTAPPFLAIASFRNLPNCEKLDVCHRYPLGLQQQIAQVLVTASAVDRLSSVSASFSNGSKRCHFN